MPFCHLQLLNEGKNVPIRGFVRIWVQNIGYINEQIMWNSIFYLSYNRVEEVLSRVNFPDDNGIGVIEECLAVLD